MIQEKLDGKGTQFSASGRERASKGWAAAEQVTGVGSMTQAVSQEADTQPRVGVVCPGEQVQHSGCFVVSGTGLRCMAESHPMSFYPHSDTQLGRERGAGRGRKTARMDQSTHHASQHASAHWECETGDAWDLGISRKTRPWWCMSLLP